MPRDLPSPQNPPERFVSRLARMIVSAIVNPICTMPLCKRRCLPDRRRHSRPATSYRSPVPLSVGKPSWLLCNTCAVRGTEPLSRYRRRRNPPTGMSRDAE